MKITNKNRKEVIQNLSDCSTLESEQLNKCSNKELKHLWETLEMDIWLREVTN
jgi:hypothetical protein